MPSINMIAPRRAEKLRLERDMRRLVFVIIAELIVAVGLGGWVCTRVITTKCQIRQMNEQLARLEPTVKEIASYDKAVKALTPKMDLLNNAKGRTMRWYNTLDGLTQSMAPSTYLTRISTTALQADNTPPTVSLTGVSSAQTRVGETMIRLQKIPDFESVDLHFTQQLMLKQSTGVQFEIGAAMKAEDASKGAKTNES
ncbi:MAG: PilN domain-containing protein [Armatimonadota bacterium]